ncbi:MAG: ATP-grasp domain-containing protein [Candidatus Pacebacteria bacterium]|nr:ATP-grasp domain-containing protein [Candidatus Paceibacterota bacterium]
MNTSRPLTYVTREIERALGADPVGDYYIVAGKTPYGEKVAAQFPGHVMLIDAPETLGTRELIEQAAAKRMMPPNTDTIVFKNTSRVEESATKAGIKLLNPKASLSETVENKMSQVEWLGDLGKKYLPPHAILPTKKLTWMGEPFVLQWAHGHTGGGTILVNSEEQLKDIQSKFPFRMARRSPYIKGSSYTVNAVVAADKILVGNISYQITGMEPFTDGMFTTVGNDWSISHDLLSETEIEYILTMVREIGTKLNVAGWRGLYGVDLIRDEERGTIHLIEINARQPASTTFESYLQKENRIAGVKGITTFEAHLKALRGEHIDEELIPVNDGAQIIQRVTKNVATISDGTIATLESAGYNVIPYPNSGPNEDLIRIQSALGIMERHGVFNERGKEIVALVAAKK